MEKGIKYNTSHQSPDDVSCIGKNYVLSIGIDRYKHISKLNNAVKDVEDFIQLITSKYDFDIKNTHILRNEEATVERIIDELKHFINIITPIDNFILYFSGHGDLDETLDEGYWIPYDAELGKRSQYISNDKICRAISKINSFHTFVIVDSCFSGSMFLDGNSRFISDAYDFPSRWGLTSGRKTIVSDGRAGENSPFAKALLSCLNVINKPININSLCDFIKQSVPASTNKMQLPIGDPLKINGHKGGQFIFKSKNYLNNEVLDWNSAISKNTEASYLKFIVKYPYSEFTKDADEQIKKLKNNESFSEINNKNLLKPELISVQSGSYSKRYTQDITVLYSYRTTSATCNVSFKGFQVSKLRVSQAQWKLVMGNNPSRQEGFNLPVENVSWQDIQEFLSKLNSQTGMNYRLPTECEWEYVFCQERLLLSEKENNCEDFFEWCSDWFRHDSFEKANYSIPKNGEGRVCRGTNPFNRVGKNPLYRDGCTGFRLAKDL